MAMATQKDRLLRVEEIAERLDVSTATVYNLLHSTDPDVRMPYVRVGASYRVLESDLEQYIRDHTVGTEDKQES